ncbi:hypothetical protein [Streptomyces tendae]
MTSPAQPAFQIDGLDVVAQTPVLIRRPLYVTVPLNGTTRFGHRRWDLAPAMPDRHSAGQAILWSAYPPAFLQTCKLYVFALVNVIDDAPRLPYARADVPSIKTIQGDQQGLRAFVTWLAERGIDQLDQVTTADLDDYYRHVSDKTATGGWKRRRLLAVQRLHAYRSLLPENCRLPERSLWGGATAAELAECETPWAGENRTHRIHPDVMEPLLSAALLTVETIAPNVLPTARELISMRVLAHEVAPDIRRQRSRQSMISEVNRQQATALLTAFAQRGRALPGRRERGQAVVVDFDALAVGGWLNRSKLLRQKELLATIEKSGLPVTSNLLRITRFSKVDGLPWRRGALEAAGLVTVIRHIRTACFLAIGYLSGIRTGEVLNLQKGCTSYDHKLQLTFLSGMQMKAGEARRDRSPATIPWVISGYAARAVTVLEALSPGRFLFPPGSSLYSQQWYSADPSRTRTPGSITQDITDFIAWFNQDVAPPIRHPAIGDDSDGKITAPRLRRTLAWHIVRRPGGIIAGATQYGHVRTQIMQGYAGLADAGFVQDLNFEEFLLRAESIHDDHQRLLNGEHVSGPAATSYRDRVAAGSRFVGVTITTDTQVNHALGNPDLQIHHGELLTCVFRRETAACKDDHDDNDSGPSWSRCRLTCRNVARTDRDIIEITRHVQRLRKDVASPAMPAPLRQSIQNRLAEHERVVADHQASKGVSSGPV